MINFNSLGFESMTGEPNTWNARVSYEQPLPSRRTLKDMPSRGISAAFDLIDLEQERLNLKYDMMIREQLEQNEADIRGALERITRHDESEGLDQHQKEKLRRAKRRETNHQYKSQHTDT